MNDETFFLLNLNSCEDICVKLALTLQDKYYFFKQFLSIQQKKNQSI